MNRGESTKAKLLAASAVSMVLSSAVTYALVTRRASNGGNKSAQTETTAQPIYSCSMHPSIISHEPGKCPICGMPLHLVEHPTNEQMSQVGQTTETTALSITKAQKQNIGLTSEKVVKQQVIMNLRIVGRVAFDPELFTAVEELRQTAAIARVVKDFSSTSMLEPIRTKLRLMGLSNSQIKSIESNSSASIGKLLPQGETWIYAEVFENDLPYVHEGQDVEITAEAIPDQTLHGTVKSISPTANPLARTVRARILVPEANQKLRPDSVVDVVVKIDHGMKLTVPTEAVMYSGQQSFVYVETANGTYTPRTVVLGPRVERIYEVISGLAEGDAVITSANFLIDSESRIRRNILSAQQSMNNESPKGPTHD